MKTRIDPIRPFEAVILAQGEYPSHTTPATLLQEAAYVVCCDGAAHAYLASGKMPQAVVGDGDSLTEETRVRCEEILHLESEQESNDLTKSMRYLYNQGKRRVAIVGGTGKREDHTLGNISLLLEYQQMGMEVVMYTNYGYFVACQNAARFSTSPGQQLSIFNMGAKGFESEGLKYPLYDFTRWWQGTLNECTSSELRIQAQGCYLLFFNYPVL
ncbi:MAG: thiamine diphosphokinase [Phocaeicola sp.]